MIQKINTSKSLDHNIFFKQIRRRGICDTLNRLKYKKRNYKDWRKHNNLVATNLNLNPSNLTSIAQPNEPHMDAKF
jgi:hypothetical protein